MLLDPNTWSKDGTIALAGLAFSDDGRYLAYCRAEAGSDWSRWQVLEIASGKLLPDELNWTKSPRPRGPRTARVSSTAATSSRKPGAEFQAAELQQQARATTALGTPQADDAVVYYRPEHPEWQYEGDGDARTAATWSSPPPLGTDERYRDHRASDLAKPARHAPIELIDNFEHEYTFVGNDGPTLYFKTDLDAPRRRLIAIDLRRARAAELEGDHSPGGGHAGAGELRGRPLHRLLSQGRAAAGEGLFAATAGSSATCRCRASARPAASRASGPTRRRSTCSPASPRRRASTTTTLPTRPKPAVPPRRGEVQPRRLTRCEQVFYRSKDGTRVPMFLAYKKGIKLRRLEPDAALRLRRVQHLAAADVLPSAGWRGWKWAASTPSPTSAAAASIGEAWHKAGTKLQKQNVFDDFIAAAEWLIAAEIHPPRKAGHPRGQQRRAAGRRRDDPAARPVRRLPAGGRRDGHAPLPEVHRRPHLGRRLRLVRRPASSSRPCWPIRPITTSGRARAIRPR